MLGRLCTRSRGRLFRVIKLGRKARIGWESWTGTGWEIIRRLSTPPRIAARFRHGARIINVAKMRMHKRDIGPEGRRRGWRRRRGRQRFAAQFAIHCARHGSHPCPKIEGRLEAREEFFTRKIKQSYCSPWDCTKNDSLVTPCELAEWCLCVGTDRAFPSPAGGKVLHGLLQLTVQGRGLPRCEFHLRQLFFQSHYALCHSTPLEIHIAKAVSSSSALNFQPLFQLFILKT